MTQYRKLQIRYLLADFFSAELIWLAFLLFRWIVYEGRIISAQTILVPAFNFYLPLIFYPLGCLVIYYLSGYYIRPFHRSYSKEFFLTLVSAFVISLIAFFLIIIDDQADDYRHYLTSLVVLFFLQFFISYAFRLSLTIYNRRNLKDEDIIILDIPANGHEDDIYKAIKEMFPTGKPIYVRPRVYDLLTGGAQIRSIDEEALVCISDLRMTDMELCIKRAFDVVASITMLFLLSPLMLILSILVYVSSKGPIIYSQERVGLYGKPFNIFKFRTMYTMAEKMGIPQLSRVDDERITKVGRFLRYYRLDELPQLWNVLKGDMSVVGPRPEREYFIRQIEEQAPYYCLLYKIRPGLTSWGPIKVGYTDTMEKMIRRLNYDIAYMENMSLVLDVRILLSTISVILRGEGR